MNLTFRDGKTWVDISELSNWDKNPSTISKEDYLDLKRMFKEYGQRYPVWVNSGKHYGTSGTVIAGNHRYKVMLELGFVEVWVEVFDVKDEKNFLFLAFQEQKMYKSWQEDKAAELLYPFRGDPDFESIKINLANPVEMSLFMNSYGPSNPSLTPVESTKIDQEEFDSHLQHTCPKCGYKY